MLANEPKQKANIYRLVGAPIKPKVYMKLKHLLLYASKQNKKNGRKKS